LFVLLIIAIILEVLALLGFGGVWSALRTAAWLLLVIGIVLFVLWIIFGATAH
jgi:uncharacterized membrane protein YtjA (UPF0391 family)